MRSSKIYLAIRTCKPRDELTLFKDENEVQKKGEGYEACERVRCKEVGRLTCSLNAERWNEGSNWLENGRQQASQRREREREREAIRYPSRRSIVLRNWLCLVTSNWLVQDNGSVIRLSKRWQVLSIVTFYSLCFSFFVVRIRIQPKLPHFNSILCIQGGKKTFSPASEGRQLSEIENFPPLLTTRKDQFSEVRKDYQSRNATLFQEDLFFCSSLCDFSTQLASFPFQVSSIFRSNFPSVDSQKVPYSSLLELFNLRTPAPLFSRTAFLHDNKLIKWCFK